MAAALAAAACIDCLPAAAHGAAAASPGAATEGADDEIIVTATRRPLDARSVPAAVDALSAAQLDAQSVRTFEDLARVDPSLQLSAYQGETQLFIRGIGAVTFLGGFESSVAVNLDGVYLGRPTAVAPALFDIARVEILKGPQGSLYGRNATGGAINLVTRAPTDDWESEASITLGNYGRADAFAAIGGPLGNGIAFRAAVGSNNHDGYTRVALGRGADGVERFDRAESRHDVSARARIVWRIAPALRLEVGGDYYRADDRAVVFHFAGPGYGNNPLFLAHLAQGEVGETDTRTIHAALLPYDRPENWGVSARLVADLGGAVLSSTTGYRRTRPRNFDDLSNSTVLGESQFKTEDAAQFSEQIELRSAPGARLRYLFGADYYRERNHIRNAFFFPYLATYLGGAGTADCCVLRANGSVATDAYALSGEVGYALAARTTLTLGGRFSRERRSGFNLLDFTGLMTVNQARLAPATFHAFTPRIVLERTLAAGTLYASVTKGYKAGGFNIGSAQNTPYRPESIWSYEVGAKLAPGAGWTLDLSAFHYDYSDLQVQDVDQNTVLIRNAASARVDGAEMEARWAAGRRLRFTAAGAYLNARFARYRTVNTKQPQLGVLDLRGNRLPQAPRWRALGSAEYDVPLGGWGALRLRGDASWQDRIYFSAFEDPRATQAAYWWLKARATLLPADGRYRVALFVDNLTDTRAFTNISITGDLDASRALGNLAPPRTWGVELETGF